jgi:hypothetical protein
MRWIFAASAAGLLLAGTPCSPATPSQEVAAAKSAAFPLRRAFLDEGPNALHFVGSAVRLRNGIPFYTIAYYLNLAELRAALGPGARPLPEMARVLIQGKVSQCFVTRFEQGVSKDRRMEFLLENLQLYWDGPGFRRDAPSLKSFLPFFDTALEKGEETRVWIRGGSIYTDKAGQKASRTVDPDLCRAFINSYLGDLRKPGADRIMREDLLKDLPDMLYDSRPVYRPSPR